MFHTLFKRFPQYLSMAFALCLAVVALVGTASCDRGKADEKKQYFEELSDFNGRVLGTLTGTPYEGMLQDSFTNVTWRYYEDFSTAFLALEKGDIDAFVSDDPVIKYAAGLHHNCYAQFPHLATTCDFSFVMQKDGALTDPVSKIIQELLEDGTIAKLKEKWLSGNESIMHIDWDKYEIQPRKNGTLRFAFEPNTTPMVYIGNDSKVEGLETELVLIIADRLDMGVELINSKIPSIFLYLKQDKADLGASCFVITDERKENVDFCTSYHSGGTAFLCRKHDIKPKVANRLELSSPKTRIAIEVGTVNEQEAKKAYPDAKYIVVPDITNGFLAVKSKKADAFAVDRTVFESFKIQGGTGLEVYRDSVYGTPGNKAVGISPKTKIPYPDLLVNDFLEVITEDGTLKDMQTRWLLKHDYNMPEIESPKHPDFKIKVGTTGLAEPFTFYKDTELSGFDIELAKRFALWCNAELDFDTYDWSGVVTAAAAGKVDFIFSNLFITKERQEVIQFSTPYTYVETVIVVREEDETEQIANVENANVFDELKSSFEKTFVREGRWKMIVRGLFVTLQITLLAGILGTILGFFFCLCLRSKQRFIRGTASAFSTLIQGVPQLVVLMIMFFVVFGRVNINPTLVGIISFAIIFAVSVAGILNTGINAIDRGQWEAATSLGFSHVGTFNRVIMPQAVRHVLPLYKSEFVAMLKLTAIVGYISIEDLTKIGDIIRSRTYEAFFPLIAVAVIYFFLSAFIAWAISRIEIKVDPKHRSRRFPKGVHLPDADDGVVSVVEEINIEKDELIRFEHLKKVYPHVTPLENVNAVVHRGEVITVIGPSGTGKSTLLRCINRLEKPTSGRVVVFGKNTNERKADLRRLRRRTGMVFQSFNLFGHLNVIENIVMAPMSLKKMPQQEAYLKGMRLLRAVGMASKALSYPDELSGGQKQRVAIARTLAMDPEIILFDEPTSALDPTMVGEVLTVIRSLAKQGLTMIIVTHEMQFARDVSTRIFYMDQGEIYEEGTPQEIFSNPQRERTRQFVRRLKVLDIQIDSHDFDFIGINNQMEQFGQKNLINPRTVLRMQSVFEELCVQMLLPRYKGHFLINFMVEYSSEDDQVDITVKYYGQTYNPMEEGDELSVMMVRGACSAVDYHSFKECTSFVNELKLTLKK